MERKLGIRWYIVQTNSKKEDEICQAILSRAKDQNLDKQIITAVVPKRLDTNAKQVEGKEPTKKVVFPGYVFVKAEINNDTWFAIRNTPGVTGFLGAKGGKTPPVPVFKEEMDKILGKNANGEDAPKSELDVLIGKLVMVKSGPFANNPFKVIAVDNVAEKVTVAIPMMGNMGEFEFKLTEVDVIKKNKTY